MGRYDDITRETTDISQLEEVILQYSTEVFIPYTFLVVLDSVDIVVIKISRTALMCSAFNFLD